MPPACSKVLISSDPLISAVCVTSLILSSGSALKEESLCLSRPTEISRSASWRSWPAVDIGNTNGRAQKSRNLAATTPGRQSFRITLILNGSANGIRPSMSFYQHYISPLAPKVKQNGLLGLPRPILGDFFLIQRRHTFLPVSQPFCDSNSLVLWHKIGLSFFDPVARQGIRQEAMAQLTTAHSYIISLCRRQNSHPFVVRQLT